MKRVLYRGGGGHKLCVVVPCKPKSNTNNIATFTCSLYHSYVSNIFPLQQGIVIVDSPGIGESSIMDEVVKKYLPEAFAFIYVINTANAGGIQKDRVGLLKYC